MFHFVFATTNQSQKVTHSCGWVIPVVGCHLSVFCINMGHYVFLKTCLILFALLIHKIMYERPKIPCAQLSVQIQFSIQKVRKIRRKQFCCIALLIICTKCYFFSIDTLFGRRQSSGTRVNISLLSIFSFCHVSE